MSDDYQNWHPKPDQTALEFGTELETEGKREIDLRKALRFHFEMDIPTVIAFCQQFPKARLLEIQTLRSRFSNLSQKRFAWRIGQSMTIDKSEANLWAEKIFQAEEEAG